MEKQDIQIAFVNRLKALDEIKENQGKDETTKQD